MRAGLTAPPGIDAEWRAHMAARALLALGLMAAVAVGGSLLPATAQAADPEEGEAMTVFVAEGEALRRAPDAADMAASVMSLLAALEPDRPVAFIDAERPSTVLGPIAPSGDGFGEMASRIEAELASGSGAGDDLLAAVAEANTLLGLERAGPGSDITVVLGVDGGRDADALVARLTPLVDRIAGRGFGLRFVTAAEGRRTADLARSLSDLSGGTALHASSPTKLIHLARTLGPQSGMSTDGLGEFGRGQGEILTVPIVVAPGTLDLRLLALGDSSGGSIRLLHPSGAEMPQDATTAIDPSHIAAWNVERPAHGIWRLEAGGIGGSLSVWGSRPNSMELSLETPGPVPIGEPVDLVGGARELRLLEAHAEMYAHVTSPDGRTVTYLLRDDGLGPDAIAGDGYFSGSAAPLTEQGEYDVVLELTWVGTAFRVNSRHSLRAQPFPVLSVESMIDGKLAAGERTLVAVASVTVDGQPYAVPTGAIGLEVSGGAESGHVVEAQARELSSSGEGWVFDVFATVAEPGTSALALTLDLEYAGRPHSYTGDFVVLSLPEPAALQVPEPAAVSPPGPEPAPSDSSFPWWVLTFPALAAVAMGVLAVRWLAMAPPAGYLYDDDQRRVADFSALDRSPLDRLLRRNLVHGRDLGVPGLDGVTFVFERGRVSVRVDRPSTTVRVEGLPLSGQAELGPQSWIGAGGRAYSFLAAGTA